MVGERLGSVFGRNRNEDDRNANNNANVNNAVNAENVNNPENVNNANNANIVQIQHPALDITDPLKSTSELLNDRLATARLNNNNPGPFTITAKVKNSNNNEFLLEEYATKPDSSGKSRMCYKIKVQYVVKDANGNPAKDANGDPIDPVIREIFTSVEATGSKEDKELAGRAASDFAELNINKVLNPDSFKGGKLRDKVLTQAQKTALKDLNMVTIVYKRSKEGVIGIEEMKADGLDDVNLSSVQQDDHPYFCNYHGQLRRGESPNDTPRPGEFKSKKDHSTSVVVRDDSINQNLQMDKQYKKFIKNSVNSAPATFVSPIISRQEKIKERREELAALKQKIERNQANYLAEVDFDPENPEGHQAVGDMRKLVECYGELHNLHANSESDDVIKGLYTKYTGQPVPEDGIITIPQRELIKQTIETKITSLKGKIDRKHEEFVKDVVKFKNLNEEIKDLGDQVRRIHNTSRLMRVDYQGRRSEVNANGKSQIVHANEKIKNLKKITKSTNVQEIRRLKVEVLANTDFINEVTRRISSAISSNNVSVADFAEEVVDPGINNRYNIDQVDIEVREILHEREILPENENIIINNNNNNRDDEIE